MPSNLPVTVIVVITIVILVLLVYFSKMKSKYIIRQKIINHLFTKITYNNIDVPNLANTKTSLTDVAIAINESYEDVFMAHHGIPDEQMICVPDQDYHYVMLVRDGIPSVIDDFWIREGQQEVNDRIYDKTKWLVPVIALVITAASLIYSIYTISQTKLQIESIKRELYELRAQKK